MIKKYPHHSDLIFCRVPLLHTFPDNILTKYSREKLSYTEVHVFSKHNTFLGHFQFLICHALARAPGTEKGKKKKKIKALILVLGLLQVVGTVKNQKLKALILVLGLLQVVGTVKIQTQGNSTRIVYLLQVYYKVPYHFIPCKYVGTGNKF